MEAAAKMLALFVTTLSGTLIIYQGQEIGMTNVPQDSTWKLEDFKDEAVLRYFREVAEQHDNDDAMKEKAYRAALARGRDNSRTPMQWNAEAHGGFTKGKAEPWIRVNPNYPRINVAAQQDQTDSVLGFWKKAVANRKEYRELFIHGNFRIVDQVNETVFAFWKEAGEQAALVLLNFSDSSSPLPKETAEFSLELLLSTTHVGVHLASSPLNPWEGRVFLKRNVGGT
jgi:oligo-1,6-glucosidase